MSGRAALGCEPLPPSATVMINARCVLRKEDHERVIVVADLPVHHFSADGPVATAVLRQDRIHASA